MDNCLVITGASRGIGLATAERFLEQGYRVINLSRTACPMPGIEQVFVDLSQPDWAAVYGVHIEELIGQPDKLVLVHNAALLRNDSTKDIEQRDFQTVLQLNVVAPSQLNQIAFAHMPSGSAILYVGSTLSEKAVANSFSYVVSKHAVAGMMKATCQDLAGTGIHTACVCPGFTETEMLKEHTGNSEAVLMDIASGVTFNRLITPDEIAEMLYFAAVNPAINGAVIHANLGQIER